jgi:hypothetical protein
MVLHMSAGPHGCGRDSYIIKRPDILLGRVVSTGRVLRLNNSPSDILISSQVLNVKPLVCCAGRDGSDA